MSKLEKLSDRFLRVGRHPFRLCSRSNRDHHDQDDSKVCCCCHTDSPLYSKCWPFIFFFSAITDYPMPLPKDKKPGQHRDWSWLPVIVVSSLVTFVYYGYLDRIVLVLLRKLQRMSQAVIYIVPFNVLFLLFIITYGRAVSQPPGYAEDIKTSGSSNNSSSKTVTSQSMSPEEPKRSQDLPYSVLGYPRWCESCQLWKPDRAHHCRVCNACVLRMDHHCPWVNGCVGIGNHRFYIQFLIYVTLLASWTFITSLVAFIQFHGMSTFDSIALAILIIAGIFTVAVGTFTLSHLWLVLINRTTIENSQFQSWNKDQKSGKTNGRLIQGFTESGKNVFNQGWKNNWMEIMGSNPWLWFAPVHLKPRMKSDGVHFGFDEHILSEYLNEDQSRRNDTTSKR
ncbi:putative Palmitoyltransferase [Rhizopus microsporus]